MSAAAAAESWARPPLEGAFFEPASIAGTNLATQQRIATEGGGTRGDL